MIWKLITFFFRKLDPENAHKVTLLALKHGLHPRLKKIKIKIKIKDLEFLNPLGVAAGFDKNAEVIEKIHSLNFGFSEVGTITPFSQYGNPKPRVFRLEEDKAIINRNGFNNLGMSKAKKQLEKYRKKKPVGSEFLVGVNIGPNKDSLDRFNDYEILSENLTEFADYITINISSPNTPNLRDFHETKHLKKVIMSVKNGILKSKSFNLEVPVFLKIAPDITSNDLESIIKISNQKNITGLIISNTTIDREKNLRSPNLKELGGLSGVPLFLKSTRLLSLANQIIKKNNYKLYLIAAGGVSDCQSAYAKILCGAHLIQLYTSMTYEGPLIATKITKGLLLLMKRDKIININDIRGSVKNPETAMKIAMNGFK
jgi:dihydroorotate dehydrogenase